MKPDAVKTAQEALEGARAILAERFAEDAELIGRLREDFWKGGRIVSKVREGKEAAGAKFADYFDFFEPLAKIPSHRALALMRGEREEILDLRLVPDPDADPGARALGPFERRSLIASASPIGAGQATAGFSIPRAGRGGPRLRPSSRSICACASGPRPRTRR